MNENMSIPMSEWEWEEITEEHAAQENNTGRDASIKEEGKREAFADFYEVRHRKRRERIAIGAVKNALVAALLGALAAIVRNIPWLCATLCVITAIFALIAAVGVGKYSEM